ncbi:radical SAM protein [Microbispora amethystogenes]|uniref:Radical SAM/SPASM domain-containing protein n=1 Tax=Microbispora amethystogenes TaxID=1427754 RepID=A0ABQ4FNF1_9ACTN|nr:radical SAM protein [Microbispora amethystogenes]GIH36324.1 radical SAM/SPASM domain-containing protein [Microbispora amethystogenes]
MLVSPNTVTFSVELPEGTLDPAYLDESGKVSVLANAVSGSMDIVTPAEVAVLERVRAGDAAVDRELVAGLLERGYVCTDPVEEEARYRAIVDGYFQAIQEAPFQFMFIPSFVCNLACPYCFEGELTTKSPRMDEEMIEAAFDTIPEIQDRHQNSGPPYITLFGGEPLLDTAYQRGAVEQILRGSYDRGYPVTAITNGVALDAYVPMLLKYGCEEVQVSLDGTPRTHDTRRVFRNGKPTFELIERSIDVAAEAGIRVLIRVLVDEDSVDDMPRFAEFAQAKGWLDHPKIRLFNGFTKATTFLYVTPDHPEEKRKRMVRGDVKAGLQEAFWSMVKQNPLVDRMLQPDLARIRSAVLEGDRLRPNLQGCSAGTSVVAFDPYGKIYGCPETVGRPQHACGTFYPEFSYAAGYRDPWRHRHVDTVPMCRDCNVKLFCGGGGCPIKAWAANGGDFNTCYCPKVSSITTRVETQLAYLLPMALRRQQEHANRPEGEEGTWEQMTRVGSFPWMS